MKSTVIWCSLVALSAAATFPPPTHLSSTCAAKSCLQGTFCREVFNTASNVVQAQCLARPVTSLQDGQCENNSPLLVSAGGDITQANCGAERDAIACPSGFKCIVGFGGAFSVCCRSQASSKRPGTCPVPQPGQFGVCASNCRVDTDCRDDLKCCKNPCGAVTCQKPVPSCDTMKCSQGEKCVMKEVQCIRAPCYPLPTCVPDCKSGDCSYHKPEVTLPVELPSTCASTTCLRGSICREVLNPVSSIIQGQCLAQNFGLVSQDVCSDGQPLWVRTATGPQQATCGRSPDRIDCPSGYFCNIAPNDAYAVCCFGSKSQEPKPGQCPRPQPGQVGICASTCNSDSECEGNNKCCKNPCGATTCQRPVQVLPEKPSCKTVKCAAGQKCVMKKPSFCWSSCDPQPKCVAVTKSGECPAPRFSFAGCSSQCQYDGDCPGSRKCCKGYFCGTTCENPRRPILTCATVDCRPDYVCKDKPMPCFYPPCPTRPVCERSAPQGTCPIFPAYVDPTCFPRDVCQYNVRSSCPTGTLCCSTPCGRQCVRPLE